MKKKLYLGIFVLISIFCLASFSYAKDNVEKASTLVSQALKSANEGNYEKMVELCTEAIEIAPGYSMGYLTRATGYFALGEAEKGRADLKRAELAKIEEDTAPVLAKRYEEKETVKGGDISVAEREPADDRADTGYSVYLRPGVRFGTDSRTLYIMDLLVPIYQDEKNILFGNVKYTPNDHDGWEINAGTGYRRLLWEDQLILGANAYYDRRKTDWGTDHEQWGVGLEAMADIPLNDLLAFDLGLTARLNYYHPITDTRVDGLGTEYAKYSLSDSGIIFEGGRVEEPMRGLDYEAGLRIPYLSDYVETWAYAGGYHYHGKLVDDVNGFTARLEVIPTDFMRLNYEFHHDNYSKAEHYGEVTFEVPFSIGNLVTGRNPFEGIGDVFTGSRDLKERMVEPVRRDVDVKVIVDENNDNVPGAGEEIEDIVFVSETGTDTPGSGTKDNPYATISYALANDPRILAGAVKTIHVMNSSTTAVIDEAAAPGSLTLSIADFLLWGSGSSHPKYANIINMPYSGHPTINDTLELNAANLEVTGLGFDVAGSHGIEIQLGAGNSGMKITNNIFKVLDSAGTNAYGISTPFGSLTASLGTEGSPIIIANNSFDIRSTGGDAYGIDLRNTGAGNDIFANIIGNDMSTEIRGDTYVYGISLYANGGGIGSEARPTILSGNRMTTKSDNYSASGILLYAENDIFAAVTNNDMSGGIWGNSSFAMGIGINSNNGNLGSETRPVIISGNSILVWTETHSAFGIRLQASNGDLFAGISGNEMDLFGAWNAYGLYFVANGDLFTAITGNEMDIFGVNDAWGALLGSVTGVIGNSTAPTLFQNNSGIITCGNNSYLLELESGAAGSYVDWTGNSFDVFGGVWSGNYPGANGPVYLDGYGGTITP